MYLDIAILIVVGLSAIVGVNKGFFKTLIGFFSGFVTLIIVILIADKVAESLLGVEFFKNLALGDSSSLKALVLNALPDALKEIPVTADKEQFLNALGGAFLAPIVEPIYEAMSQAAQIDPEMSAASAMSIVLANYLFIILVGVALFIIIRILLKFLTDFFDSLTENSVIDGIDKLLGFLIGVLRGAAFVFVFFVILSVAGSASLFKPVVEQIPDSTLAKPISEETSKLTAKYLTGSDSFLTDLLAKIGIVPTHDMTEDEQALYDKLVAVRDPLLATFDEKLAQHSFNADVTANAATIRSLLNNAVNTLYSKGAPEETDFVALNTAIDLVTPTVVEQVVAGFDAVIAETSGAEQALASLLETIATQLDPLSVLAAV